MQMCMFLVQEYDKALTYAKLVLKEATEAEQRIPSSRIDPT